MRLALGLLAVLALALIVAGERGLARIGDAQRVLIRESLPQLAESGQSNRHLVELMLRVGSIGAQEHIPELLALERKISEDIAALTAPLAEGAEAAHRLHAIEQLSSRLIRFSVERLIIHDRATKLHRRLELAAGDLERHLAIMSERARPSAGAPDGPASGALSDAPTLLLELALLARQCDDAAATVARAVDETGVSAVAARIADRLGRAGGLIAALPETSDGTFIAEGFADLRAILLDEGGIVTEQRKLLDVRERQAELESDLSEALAEIWSESADAVTEAQDRIATSANRTWHVVADTQFEMRVAGAILFAALALIGYLLVERGIVRRLARLSGGARRIADGDHEHRVLVNGPDELGEMAAALEVFKNNSRELSRSNDELQRFAYAASHDLRSPVRAIRDLATWTIEDAGDTLNPQARTNLELLLKRADRLSRLLGGLLDYALIGRNGVEPEKVEFSQMLRELIRHVAPGGNFELLIASDIGEIATFEVPLRQTLLSLFNNAVKHHDRQSGRIIVTVEKLGRRVEISVADDGPGVAPEYHERIFELFKTLRPRDEVEGSGLGLAIARKQIERFGGRIRVISDPAEGRGTRFLFDWPLCEPTGTTRVAA